MRSYFGLSLLLILVLASCSPRQLETAPLTSRLFVYRPDPSALLVLADDYQSVEREIPLPLPPACLLSALYPSPGQAALVAELSCANGPLTALVNLSAGGLEPLIGHASLDIHFLGWSGDDRYVYLRVGAITDPRILRFDTRSGHVAQTALDPYTYDLGAGSDPGRIIYAVSHGLGFGSELWTAGSSGQRPRLLLSDPDNIIAFARSSPAGDRIAFIKMPDTQVPYSIGQLWLMDSSGAVAHTLADVDAGRGYAAAWSPDGNRLAFVLRSNPDDARADQSFEALVGNLAVLDIPSGVLTQVTNFERGRPGTPVWSPGGNTLIFGYVLDGRMDVQVADPFGSQDPSSILKSACCPVFMRK